MLKRLKKGLRKLGSTSKLQEHEADGTAAGSAQPSGPRTSALPAAAAAAALAAPPSWLPPRAPKVPVAAEHAAPAIQAVQPLMHQAAPAGSAAATTAAATVPVVRGGSGSGSPAVGGVGEPAQAAPTLLAGTLEETSLESPSVDYELLAGPLDMGLAGPEAGEGSGVGASQPPSPEAPARQHAQHDQHDQHQVCYDTGSPSSGPSAEEEAAAAALLAGGSSSEGGTHDRAAAAAADDAAAEAEAAAAAGAEGTEQSISDALQAMMYLTEDGEGAEDCVSVVSDVLSEEELPDDISELSRALEALEGEALGSSPGALSAEGSRALEDRLAEQLGLSPDADPSAFSQQMAKLYNNLGLKMMERRKHDEALMLLRKAEAVVDNDAVWAGRNADKRQRMQAITYNNLGCLFKRRNMAQLALQYLQKALALEENVQNSSSTHLNICAAYSALRRPKEALSHAEQSILLLQRHLWAPTFAFQDGLNSLVRQLAGPGASRHLLGSANVLAMAYHNAAVEHEKLGRLREGLVSFTRAYLIASKCLGAKAQMTTALSRALKAFQQRQARHLPTGAAHAARKTATLVSSRSAATTAQGKRGTSKGAAALARAVAKSGGTTNLSKHDSKAVAGSTLPLDKGRTTATSSLPAVRPPSSSRLASQLQQRLPPPGLG